MAIEVKERILVVEDEAIVLLDLKNRLNTLGYVIVGSSSYGEEAIKKADETRPDIVLMDIGLKGKIDGVEAADQIKKTLNIPIIYLTANSDFNTLQRAKVTEPFGYILKPFDERELRTTIEMALYKHKLDIKLNENRRWMETTLNSIADSVITTDVSAHITFINPAAEAMTGWKSADAMNKDISEVLNIVEEDTRTRIAGQVQSVLERNSPYTSSGHTVLVCCNGAEVPVDSTVSPIKDVNGKAIGVAFVFRDVSDKRKAEKALRESEANLARAQEIAHIGDWELDLKNNTMRWSSEVWHILGVKGVETSLELFIQYVLPEDRDLIMKQYQAIPNDRKFSSFDFRIARPDGTIRYVHDEAEYFRNESGEVIKLFGTMQDITDRKLAEEALKVSEERFFNVTNSTLDAIVSINETSTIIFWNKAAERIFGYSKYEAIGKPFWIILPAEFHSQFSRSMEVYNASGKSLPRDAIMQYNGLKKDGSTFPIEMSLSGWKEKGKSFFTAIIRDITERLRAEEVVRKSEDRFSSSFRVFPAPSLITNLPDGRIIEVNDSFIKTTGYSRDEVIGKTSVEVGLINATVGAELTTEMQSRGSIGSRVIEFRKKSGEQCLGLLASNYMDIEGGQYLITNVIDITEIRRAERERAEAEEIYRNFSGDRKDALTIIEGENVKYASPGALDIFGIRPDEMTHDVHIALAAPEEKERVREITDPGNGNSGPVEYWIVRKDGSRRKIRNHHLVISKDEKSVRKYIITRDVTDERRI
ncbi:MAG: putative diguanylate cyclase [Methanocella sp. PtaU1.Bin125]|nr:MAG: putative diguanylate cyclase [Methanocella sp. PtaU1.Bin125]